MLDDSKNVYLADDDPIFTGTFNNQSNRINWTKLTGIDFAFSYTKIVELSWEKIQPSIY